MHTTVCPPLAGISANRNSMADDEVAASVAPLLRSLYSSYATEHVPERRWDRRFPYPYLVRLVPVATDGFTPVGRPMVVVGKHLSERGLGFYHAEPLAHRRVIVTLETVQGASLSLLADLHWCRFTGHGWYESGGRFLEIVDQAAG